MKDRVINAIFNDLMDEDTFEPFELTSKLSMLLECNLTIEQREIVGDIIADYALDLQRIAFAIGFETALKLAMELEPLKQV